MKKKSKKSTEEQLDLLKPEPIKKTDVAKNLGHQRGEYGIKDSVSGFSPDSVAGDTFEEHRNAEEDYE